MLAVTTIGDNVVAVLEHPTPDPGPGDVRVRVHGAGLNRADLIQRAGLYPAPPGSPPDIPGLEFSGVIDAVGAEVDDLHDGDAVFGIAGGGGQAEFVIVPAEHCARVPPGLDLVAMGGVPEAFVTAHDAMITRARARAGEWVLIHAVGSGVGTAALQLAKSWGCKVVGTARSSEKLERCRALGLDAAIVPPRDNAGALDMLVLADQVRVATSGGADVTLDLVGGDYVTAEVLGAAPGGRIVCIGTLAGGQAQLPILAAMQKRLEIHGTVLRTRDRAEKASATAAFVADVLPRLADGRLAPIIEAVVPLTEVSAAYDLMATDATFGKLILDCR
jgi:putative PIG3 family NAD(P)H quinone oxidoreductase